MLPGDVKAWSGVKASEGLLDKGVVEVNGTKARYLSALNDRGWTFDQIADHIDEHWEEL